MCVGDENNNGVCRKCPKLRQCNGINVIRQYKDPANNDFHFKHFGINGIFLAPIKYYWQDPTAENLPKQNDINGSVFIINQII